MSAARSGCDGRQADGAIIAECSDGFQCLYRTRFPGQVVLCGATEAGVDSCGAHVERAEVAVLFDQPLGVVAVNENQGHIVWFDPQEVRT